MPLSLYNTLTRSQDTFHPMKPGHVGLYSCGPTVYFRPTIGNYRSFLFADTLRRVLEANNFSVTHVMNITDVGHLVGDGDDGVDKVQMSAEKTGKTAWDIAAEYTKIFLDDIRALNIEMPHVMPKATDHIAEQISMIQTMEEKGFTYRTSDGIYFDTAKLPTYGRLSGQKSEEKEEGARVAINPEKRNSSDFALWKFSPEDAKRHMEWDSPWGKGFPGWHIECSAMSEKYLGVPFDIHTGGIDHIAVHHENEIAQTMAARGVLEANVWMHNEFLLIDGGRMGKSLGNAYTLDDLTAKGIELIAYRLFVLGAHYRSQLNFTWESAQAAQNAYEKLCDTVREWDQPSVIDQKSLERFMERVNDDLDTPGALAVMWNLVKDESLSTAVRAATLLAMDKIFGLGLEQIIATPIMIPDELQKLLDERAQARQNKNWSESDRLRDDIAALGYEVKDTADGQRVRRV